MNAYIVETDKLRHNYRTLKERAGGAVLWAVVKGNGYGLGAGPLAKLLAEEGADHFAVTAPEEAGGIRALGLEGDILMLRETSEPEEIKALLELNAICTIGSRETAEAVQAAAVALGVTARAHCKIDTGMGRYGFLPHETENAKRLWDYDHIRMEGIYTHFHTAGNHKVTQRQFAAFRGAVDALKTQGLDVGMVHCCNSLAFWYEPEMRLDGVRLGSALLGRVGYGAKAGLQRVGYAEARVETLKTIPKGHNVGYGGDCTVKRDTRIAVIGVGYLHGYAVERGYDVFRPVDCLRSMGRYLKYLLQHRRLTVEVNGKTCTVLGHVGMVNLVADVTDIPCALHDPVTISINPLDVKAMEIRYR